jgi:phosphorylcholine metabolism protein LicD
MAKILTSTGISLYYKNRVLYGQKQINKPVAFENLVLLKKIFEESNIPFMLIAGTLLGAIREHDFITHDEDIDLAFLIEDKSKVIDVLPRIIEEGFSIVRYDRRNLLSVMRNNEYIDFYFFKKEEIYLRRCNGWLIPAKFLENTTEFFFKGVPFSVPKDYVEYLKYEYGETWRTPIKWFDYGISKRLWLKIYVKERSKEFLPDCLLDYFARKAEKKFEKKFRKKIEKYIEIGGSIS